MTTTRAFEGVPDVLKTHAQWVCSRMPDKVPVTPSGKAASCTDSSTWSTFDACRNAAIQRGWGVAFVFTADDPFAVIDLDHVRNVDTGETEPWALAVIDELASYTEISWSGTGWHIVIQGKLPSQGRKRGRVELYDERKCMTLTGNTVIGFGTEDVVRRDLSGLHGRMLSGELDPATGPATTQQVKTTGDASADDFALACKLARQHECDEAKVREAFLKQATPRSKIQRADYVSATVRNAIARVLTSKPMVETNNRQQLSAADVVSEKEITAVDTDLPVECLDGWLGEICKERMRAFPRAYAWLALLAAASVYVPRETKARCNLFVDLDGPVHSGKSSAFEMAFHLLSLGKPALMKLKAGSAEGLAERMGDVGGAGRLLYPDELAHLLEKSMIERSSFARFLTSAFYDDEQELTVAKRKPLTFNARLTLAGGTVDDQFGDLFGSATTGGLYDRFLFGKCPSGYQYLWRPLDDVQPAYVPSSEEEGLIRGTVERPLPVCLQPSIFEVRDRWIKELGISPRVAELCIRAATISASFDGRRTLTEEMLGPALELAMYQTRVRFVLQPNPGENPDARMSFTIRNWMTKHAAGGQWVGRRMLFRMVSGHRLGPGVFDRALRAMEFNGELESGKVGKQTVIRLVDDPSVSKKVLAPADTSAPIPPTVSTSHAEDESSI